MPNEAKSVLIVDDHAYIRDELRLFIQSRPGMCVCGEASDGVEAVAIAKRTRPDLILMDLSMPRTNGVEAAAAIRQELRRTHLVVFTLFSDLLGGDLWLRWLALMWWFPSRMA